MMVLDHVGDQKAMVYAQLGQQPLVRTTATSLEPRRGTLSCLSARPPDLATATAAQPEVACVRYACGRALSHFYSSTPTQVHGGGGGAIPLDPSSRVKAVWTTERFVAVTALPLVDLPVGYFYCSERKFKSSTNTSHAINTLGHLGNSYRG